MQPRELPTVEQLTAELGREKYKRRYKRVLRSTIYTLIVVAAVAVLVATIWMPVLQIYGASMAPTLDEGDVVADCDLRQRIGFCAWRHGGVLHGQQDFGQTLYRRSWSVGGY